MAMQATFNPQTGEAEFSNLGNGGNLITSEELGYINEGNGRFEFEQLEYSDPSYREQFSDNDNALAEVDQFALDSAFALCGGEEFVRGVIETAPQWLDAASIEMFNDKIDELFASGEISALEDVFAGLVGQYLEAAGYNDEEGFADDAFDPEGDYAEYAGLDPNEDFTPDPELEEEAAEFVNSLTEEDVEQALNIWESTSESGAARAVEIAAHLPSNHPVRLTAAALAHVATSYDDPKEVFDELSEMIGGSVALACFAAILENVN
jgi:hypothetical protein